MISLVAASEKEKAQTLFRSLLRQRARQGMPSFIVMLGLPRKAPNVSEERCGG